MAETLASEPQRTSDLYDTLSRLADHNIRITNLEHHQRLGVERMEKIETHLGKQDQQMNIQGDIIDKNHKEVLLHIKDMGRETVSAIAHMARTIREIDDTVDKNEPVIAYVSNILSRKKQNRQNATKVATRAISLGLTVGSNLLAGVVMLAITNVIQIPRTTSFVLTLGAFAVVTLMLYLFVFRGMGAVA